MDLVATKLMPRPVRPRHILRRRLQAVAVDVLTHRLVLLVAPTGYGKSVVLAGWCAGALPPTAWLSLDDDDNDPALLTQYLIAAFRSAG